MEIVRPIRPIRLTKSIYFVGAHCTGKSTLAKALYERCEDKHTILLKEVARTVLKKKNYTADDITNCIEMQEDILQAQFEREKEIIEDQKFFIADRAGIDPIVYARFYMGREYGQTLCELVEWKVLVERYRNKYKSLVILLEPNEDFLVADGTRKMPKDMKEWFAFSNSFEEFMLEVGIHFLVIPGRLVNLEERVQQVVEWMHSS